MRHLVAKAIFVAVFAAIPGSYALAQAGPVAQWRFDDAAGNTAKDAVSGQQDNISGSVSWIQGVEGSALHLDGFSTMIERDAAQAPALRGSFSVDTWVVIQSYPWGWLAVAEQRNQSDEGFSFGLDEDGHVGLQVGVWGRWEQALSAQSIPLNHWTHIAAVYDVQKGIALYIDGKPAGSLSLQGEMSPAKNTPLMIGRNLTALPVAGSVRHKAMPPVLYSLDGALDNLQIYDRPQSTDEIQQQYAAVTPSSGAVFPARHWPVLSGVPAQRLQASYARLSLYPEWDAQWRMGAAADVVVSFSGMPFHYAFWRGSNYGACMVTENGIWIGDQSFESSTKTGTAEHMNDKFDAFSHVSVLENSAARVVVHWRYALVDVAGNLSDIDPATGWGNWADEYYYIYPDGVSVRNGTIHGTKWKYSFTEPALLLEPGQKPEDVIALHAASIANERGQTKEYSWETMPSFPFTAQPEGANIALLHTKSEYRPFYVYQPGVQIGPYGWPPEVRAEYSHFPVWDHWPVNFIPSDGRFALHADHYASAAVMSPNMKGTWIEGAGPTKTAYFLFGLTKKSPEELAVLDRSWLHAPSMSIAEADVEAKYDAGERAYIVTASSEMKRMKRLQLTVAATPQSPMVNAAIVVRGWSGQAAQVRIDGKAASAPEVLTGVKSRLEGDDLIVWIRHESQRPVHVEIVR